MKIIKVADIFLEFVTNCSQTEFLDVNDFLSNFELEGTAEDLIDDCIEGYLRHTNLINKIVELYTQKMKNPLEQPTKINVLKVILYLFLFELEKIGINQYQIIITHYLNPDVQQFLKFLIENITEDIQNVCLQFYDFSFVQDAFVSPLLSFLPDLQMIVEKNETILNKPSQKIIPKSTIAKPFTFTLPRDKNKLQKVKEDKKTDNSTESEELIYKTKSLTKIPSQSDRPKSPRSIKSSRKSTRVIREIKKHFTPLNCKDHRYLQTGKSEKTMKKMAEILEERQKELQFDKRKSCDLPPLLQLQVPVKQTITAILREGALVNKKLQQQMKKVEELEQGTFTSVNFDKLQAEFQVQENAKNLAFKEEKLLQTRLLRERALLARQKIINEKQKRVKIIKEEMQSTMEESMQEKKKVEEKKKNIVHDVIASENKAKIAVQKLQKQRREITNRLQNELKDIMNKAKDESEEEIRHRRAIVQEIRALENISVENRLMEIKETTGRLVLHMSLTELRERLSLLKTWQKEIEDAKRSEIQAEKQLKEKQLATLQEFVGQFRQFESQTNKQQKLEQENELKMLEEKFRIGDPDLKPLRDKLEETKAQRIYLEKQQKVKAAKQQVKLNELSNAKNKYLDLL